MNFKIARKSKEEMEKEQAVSLRLFFRFLPAPSQAGRGGPNQLLTKPKFNATKDSHAHLYDVCRRICSLTLKQDLEPMDSLSGINNPNNQRKKQFEVGSSSAVGKIRDKARF